MEDSRLVSKDPSKEEGKIKGLRVQGANRRQNPGTLDTNHQGQ